MSIAPQIATRSLRVPSPIFLAAALFALVASGASDVRAQAQSKAQQGCLNALYGSSAKIGAAQGKANTACIKARQSGADEKLGTPPEQEQTTDACLGNDVAGKVGKTIDALAATETDKCTAEPPSFGTAGAAQMAGAAESQSRAIIRDLFGPNLQPIVVSKLEYVDSAAVSCQPTTAQAAGKFYDTLWKEMKGAAKAVLAGKSGPAVTSGAALETAITAALTADAKGKIAKGATKLTQAIGKKCGATLQPLPSLLRGKCMGATTTAAQFSACAVTATRCNFCRAIRGSTGLGFDCDAFDDDAANGSCVGFASAHEITNPAELITGPLADGQVGDTMIENSLARFIIQQPGVRDMSSVGAFGGNIIDVELVGHPGLDNFLEIQPAINIETVVNAISLEIVNDGSDGSAAIVRTCGPDDILDFVNPSTIIEGAGLDFPAFANDNDQEVEACTEYILEPDATYLKMVTTIFNDEPVETGFPVGDFVNGSGEVEQWGSGDAGIGVRLLGTDMGVFSYFGYGEAEGVDYGITTIPIPEATEETGYFSTSGVSYILHSQSVLVALLSQDPVFDVPAGGSKSFTRYFGVGDGSGGNAVTLENLVKGQLAGPVSGCVTVGGLPAPGARVSAGPVSAGAITRVRSTWVTGPDGCYSGTMSVGTNIGFVAWREGTMYEGGAATPPVHLHSVDLTTPVVRNFALPAPGHVSVTVVDENSDPMPARVSIVGFDPSPDPVLGSDTGLFRDRGDIHPFGITRAVYTNAAGAVDFDLEPGSYRIYVSRGAEYSLFEQALTVTGGVTTNVSAEIARVIDTPGFISSDHHVHGIASADSQVSESDRVRQFAGEGVDNVIMTDHHAHTDLNPRIAAMGFAAFVTSTIGEEITTWDTGHYNAYPMLIDPTRPSGGSTDWGGAAPAGEDFPSLGAFILTPAEIDALAKTGSTATPETIVQINHIDSHFVPMRIDTSEVPPQSFMTPAELLNFRMDPASGNLFHHFEALELWNGHNRSHQSQFLNERIGVWFNLLNQGLITTMITDTDTHSFANLETAGGRTWAASSTDDPPSISPAEMTESVRDGKAVGGQGLYVQTRLIDATVPSNVADLTLTGDTLLTVSNPVAGLNLEIKVQAPLWAQFDTIRVYANAATIPSPTSSAPELFGATPTQTLTAPANFTITTINVHPSVTGGSRREALVTIPFTNMTQDTWFVVVVKGSDGVSRPMFPVHPANLQQAGNTTLANLTDGNLGQQGVTSLGVTNALYADVDGNPGFDAPLAP